MFTYPIVGGTTLTLESVYGVAYAETGVGTSYQCALPDTIVAGDIIVVTALTRLLEVQTSPINNNGFTNSGATGGYWVAPTSIGAPHGNYDWQAWSCYKIADGTETVLDYTFIDSGNPESIAVGIAVCKDWSTITFDGEASAIGTLDMPGDISTTIGEAFLTVYGTCEDVPATVSTKSVQSGYTKVCEAYNADGAVGVCMAWKLIETEGDPGNIYWPNSATEWNNRTFCAGWHLQ